tara:strand:+ start:254 stop:463 length:210 start_codon:yes stop_codon:yes gene_type:complete
MKNKSYHKKSLKLINQIQNIRKKNNVNWMDMLRLAFKHDPKRAAKIMSNIYTDDQRVSNLVRKLIKSVK